MADFDQELDASGLNCPLPILRAKQTGNTLMESKEEGGKFHFLIKKA